VPRPCGPFKLLVDPDLSRARSRWDNERANYKAANSIPRFDNNIPIEIHHIQPIKFGGDPVDSGNLVPLLHPDHSPFTTWWGGLQADLERARGIYPPNDPNAPITFLNPGGHL